MFDEDLTSLYPSIIMSLNIGKETYVGRVLDLMNDRNNRLGLNDLQAMDPKKELCVENPQNTQTHPTPVSYTHLTLPTIYSV